MSSANSADSDLVRSSFFDGLISVTVSRPTRPATDTLATSMPSGTPRFAFPRSSWAMLRKHSAGSAKIAAKLPSVVLAPAGRRLFFLA